MTDSVGRTAPKAPASAGARLLSLSPLLAVGAALLFVYASGLWRHLSLHELKVQRQTLKAFVRLHPVESLFLYVGCYCAIVALSIPGALVMTLTGGFLFGTWVGGAAAAIGVSSGAVVMFLVAHTALGGVLRRWVDGDGLISRVEAGVRRHAFLYIFSLRLMPALPIWMVNIAAAFVKTPLWVYGGATFLGILPSTFIYASVGAGLDGVFAAGGTPTLGSLFRPQVLAPLFGLGALAIAPLAYQIWRGRR
jgi:uncharacterized membrane protein YdjX (TVP38/TMEM64 family)